MTSCYEAKIIKEDDNLIFEFPILDSIESAQELSRKWILDNQTKMKEENNFFIRHKDQLIKIIQ